MSLLIRRAANVDHESKIHDIIAAKEKQATAKQAFVFPNGNRRFPMAINEQMSDEIGREAR